jgi:NAD(P)H-hydrate epimerase
MYSGSPTLAALAAYRSGVDLVTVAAPQRAADIIATFTPDLITHPLKGDYLTPRHVRELLNLVKRATAVAIGGGLERHKTTFTAIQRFLRNLELPCVIDADAIHAVAANKDIIRDRPFVLTPHTYEFWILSGIKLGRGLKGRPEAVKKVAAQLRTIILLKGFVDVISDGRRVALNRTGSPHMSVGGTGDTLTGIVGALLARRCDPFIAACAAAYINGRAGERAAQRLGESLLASDILEEIPRVLRKV